MKIRIITLLALLITLSARADWELSGPVTPSYPATFWSLAHGTSYPPTPCVPSLFENNAVYRISNLSGNQYTYDDLDNFSHTPPEMTTMESEGGGSGEGDGPTPLYDYEHDFTNLWLSVSYITNAIENVTNLQAAVVMHNTINLLMPYEIFSTTDLSVPMSNWVSEGIWIAYSTNTPANIDVGDRTNQNFFRARLWNGQFTYGIPKSGELFLLLPDTNTISAVINDVTNPISPFYSNWAMARLPATNGNILQTYNFNAGYSHDDSGDTNYLKDFPTQNIRAFLGFSATASNVALSFTAITNVDTRNWPKLYDLECWHCTNLISAKITGCPQLHRICFESLDDLAHGLQGTLDFTGSTNLADVRCAQNAFTNIVFGGAGPKIFHLCTRDLHNGNSPRLPNMDFSQFPSMKELWVWRDASFVQPLVLTHTNCPQLTSAQAYGNFFYTADFGGQTNLDNVLLSGTVPATLTNINIIGCTKLRQVEVIAQSLSTYWVDSILTNLDNMGYHGSSIDDGFEVQVQGNDRPSVEGYRAVSNLVAKLWTVNVAPLASGTPQIPTLSVTGITTNSATINWTTDIASDSIVYYGTTDFGSSASDGALVTSHSITLTGLSIDTTYHYYVHSTASGKTGTSGNHQFNTLPPPPPPNTNAIWFTNNSTTVSMQVFAPAATSITWVWGNGTVTTNVTSVTTNLGSTSLSNAVIVDPATALLGFGASCGNSYSVSNTLLKSVSGLTNYPNLGSLYLLSTYLNDLSLAKCTNLTHLALIHTAPSTNTENGWFHDLAIAQAAGKPSCTVTPLCDGSGACNNFYCPLNPGPTNTAPGSDYSILQGLGWTITPLN